MIQSRIDSFMEAVTNVAIGFAVSLLTWLAIQPLFNLDMSMSANLGITAIFTAVSIVRQYVLRRAFNGRSPWTAIKGAMK